MTSTCGREKAVFVAIYEERPTRRLPLSMDGQGVHHRVYHHYHYFHDVSQNEGIRRGSNRKAELLNYTRYLRSSAQTDTSASVLSSPLSSHITRSPPVQVVSTDRKPKHASSPACFSKWEFLKPSFLRSIASLKTTKGRGKMKAKNSPSTNTKMKELVKRFQVHKHGSFLAKLSRAVQKCH